MLRIVSHSDRLTCFPTDKFLQAAIKIPLCCFLFKGQIKVHLVRHCVSKRLIRVKFRRLQETNLSETKAHPLFAIIFGEKWNSSHALS